jgi:hypothetical protein
MESCGYLICSEDENVPMQNAPITMALNPVLLCQRIAVEDCVMDDLNEREDRAGKSARPMSREAIEADPTIRAMLRKAEAMVSIRRKTDQPRAS